MKMRPARSPASASCWNRNEIVGAIGMTARAVHWHEGMFLRPHHMQAGYRHVLDLFQTGENWDHHYNWGLRELSHDPDALKNQQLVIRRLRVRLRDGTLVAAEDGELPAVDLKPLLEK